MSGSKSSELQWTTFRDMTAGMPSDLVVDLPVRLDRTDSRPLPTQLCDAVRALLASDVLHPGDRLPSTRVLAAQLGIARGGAVQAYEQLQAEGYLVGERGSGTRINPALARLYSTVRPPAAVPPPSADDVLHLRPGAPDVDTLTTPAWRTAWREAATRVADARTDPLGSPELRREIAEHVRQMRGVVAEPDRVVVTAGAREGFALLLRALAVGATIVEKQPPRGSSGRTLTIGVESPGYPSLRRVPVALGHRIADLHADEHGLDPASTTPDLDLVLVTPSHQFPHGGTLAAGRRVELASRSREQGWLIVEDDHDSEIRHVGAPVPALTALEPERTVMLGTFSSVISPGIACGYLILPGELVAAVRDLRGVLGQPVGAVVQGALARYLASGELRRRTQRQRRVYRRRREIVLQMLGDVPGAQLRPLDGGLHAVLVTKRPEAELVARCRGRGVGVVPLGAYWGGESSENGIVFGFGAHDDASLMRALAVIAEVAATQS